MLAITGLILLVVGTYGFTRLDVHTSGQSLQIWLIMRGLGLGCVSTPLQTLADEKFTGCQRGTALDIFKEEWYQKETSIEHGADHPQQEVGDREGVVGEQAQINDGIFHDQLVDDKCD